MVRYISIYLRMLLYVYIVMGEMMTIYGSHISKESNVCIASWSDGKVATFYLSYGNALSVGVKIRGQPFIQGTVMNCRTHD